MAKESPKRPFVVRVAVINGVDKLRLKIAGPYKIVLPNTLKEFRTGTYLHEVEISPELLGVKIGESSLGVFGIKILQESESSIYINGRRFRGSVDIVRTKELKLLVVNNVNLEEYLYGVLYHEVSHRWPMEVLKAQAIASRTFAIYQSLVNKDRDYDLTSDVYSQVYGGRTSEKARTNRAVRLTSGMILKFNNEIFPAYYHATCGGHTSDADTLWKINLPALKGKTCPYCSDSPHLKWTKSMPIEEIQERLAREGYNPDRILGVQILDRDPANRVLNIKIEAKEANFKITGNRFRLLIGPNIIRSTNFEVFFENDRLIFKGFGWGHGIGMCQWGAYHMARMGKTAEGILKFYYPSAEIDKLKPQL